MKNIFKSIMMLLSGAVLFASCLKEAAPLASEISVNKQEVTFTGYAGSSAQIQKVQVTSNGDWFITCNEDWVTVNPSFGSAGMTKVEITVTDNVDSYNELNGPRSAVVNFCYGETGVAPLTVKQTGETGLDASRTYRKVTSQDQVVAGGYLVVFEYTKDGAAKTIALDPLSSATEDTYKYAYGSDVVIADDAITMPNANNAWILEAAEGGYLLQTAGKYLFQDGNSFRATTNKEKAHLWTVKIEENGEATIKNISFENRWIQFSIGYGSAGCYASAQENAVMPTLYVDSVPPTDEVLDVKDVTVPAFATSAKIKVQSNRSWSVRCHDEWIKSFTKTGKNNGEIEVTFDEYTNTTEDRTATFQVISEGTNTVITFTQAKVAPTMTVEEFLADAVAKGDYAILTGSIENIKNTNYGNFDLQDETGKVYIYGLYDVNGAKVFTDLGLKEGDIVTLYGPKDVYNNNPQVKNAIYVSHESSKIRRKLAFSAETAEAKIGNPFTAPTLSGDATDVEYTSSDVEVATVDAATGEVTLLAEGTTTITANGPETETHLAGTASYTLTVTAKTPRALAFSAATAEATLGEEFTAPTLSGETAGVVYSSSDEEVATVDPATGAVTLVAAGETTITATAAEDESFLAGTASYALTVVPAGPRQVTVAQFLALSVGTTEYQLTGVMSGTYNTTYGNFYLEDETGKVLVYGLTKTKQSSNDKSFASLGLRDGDTLTLIGQRADYNGTAQVGGPAYYVSHVAAPFVDFSSASASVNAEATTYTIEVLSNTDWTATPSAGVSLSKTSGNGNASVVMTFAANTSSEAVSHSVEFTAGGSTATFQLTQKAVPAAGETVVFEETFAKCTGTMGWSGSVANGTFATDNTGWTVQNAYGANGAAKFGAGSKLGTAQTPTLNFTGTATLTFKAGAWSGDSTNLKLSMTKGTLSVSKVTLKSGDWTEYEVTITGATSGATIKFEGNSASKGRFFLDDVKIVQAQ